MNFMQLYYLSLLLLLLNELLISQGEVKLDVSLTPSTGYFEVSEGDSMVVSGKIHSSDEAQLTAFFDSLPATTTLPKPTSTQTSSPPTTTLPETPPSPSENLLLNTNDVYKELRLRGYQYQNVFQGIVSVDQSGSLSSLFLIIIIFIFVFYLNKWRTSIYIASSCYKFLDSKAPMI